MHEVTGTVVSRNHFIKQGMRHGYEALQGAVPRSRRVTFYPLTGGWLDGTQAGLHALANRNNPAFLTVLVHNTCTTLIFSAT